MDLKQLLNQTTIQNKHAEQLSENEIESDIDSESEPEPEPEPEPELQAEIKTESDIDSRYLRPWNKLEKGMKMNRILLFVNNEKEVQGLSDIITKELKNLLFKGCENGIFNKISEVKYNTEEGLIESFKSLEFNESSKKYKLKSTGTKNRSVSKSRSNIDRVMKKK